MKPRSNSTIQARRESALEAALPLAVAAEREHFRKLLHDGIGQMLTSASFVASSLRHRLAALGLEETAMADEMISLLNEAIAESRTLASRCQPPPKDALGEVRQTN